MKNLAWILPLCFIVFLLGGEKPVVENTTIPVWNAKSIAGGIYSDTFNTHNTKGHGRFYATYQINHGGTGVNIHCKIYVQFTNLRDPVTGGPIFPSPGDLIDSVNKTGADTVSKPIRIYGHLLHRYRVVPFTGDNGSTITMTVEVK